MKTIKLWRTMLQRLSLMCHDSGNIRQISGDEGNMTWKLRRYCFSSSKAISRDMTSYYSPHSYYPHPHSYYGGLAVRRGQADLVSSGTDSDLLGSLSGGGGMSDPGSCFSLDICPDLILALIAAAAAAGFYFLYITITMAGRKRKRKRSLCEPQTESVGQILSDILNLGEVGYTAYLQSPVFG